MTAVVGRTVVATCKGVWVKLVPVLMLPCDIKNWRSSCFLRDQSNRQLFDSEITGFKHPARGDYRKGTMMRENGVVVLRRSITDFVLEG